MEEFLLNNPYFIVACGIGLLSTIFYLVLLIAISSRQKKSLVLQPSEDISVVMAVKNEEKIIADNVREWLLTMRHKDMDMVVADDQSWDGTPRLLKELSDNNEELHVVSLTEDRVKTTGKKFALTLGIKGAKNENVLLTDADCLPSSDDTAGYYSTVFKQGYTMVLGHSPLVGKGGFVQKMEAFSNSWWYLGFSSLGMFYMGVGRALAYNKEQFLKVGAFKSIYHLPYGDDDVFVNKFGGEFKKYLLLHPNSFVKSEPLKKVSDYWAQKRRHLAASKHYKFGHKIILSFPHLLNLLFLIGLGTSILLQALDWKLALIAFASKILLDSILSIILGSKIMYKNVAWFYGLWQFISPLFQMFVKFTLLIKPVKRW